ncbi:MAG: phosphoribosylformylglycinamidine synthase I, partial [Elusimicrobia bacterium RIFCSPLOWO2_01_FULL_59_12]
TNCDQETAHALRMAGATPEVVHINQFISGKRRLEEFRILILAGGFSYGDDIAAGKILANELRSKLGADLASFIAKGNVVIGICNGFQALVKTGYLPGDAAGKQTFTLAGNESGRFQCHWTRLQREDSACAWLNGTDSQWDLPIAHGEGKFWPQDAKRLAALEKNRQVVFRYQGDNPNGSARRIAGVCNARGNVVGLMPHPERHVQRTQHPEWTRMEKKNTDPVGLQFFKAAVRYAERLS